MKKLLSLLTVLIVCIAALVISASAATVASGTCGTGVTWSLDDAGTLTISGTGAMADYASGEAPWYSYSGSITKVVVGDGVTHLGKGSFSNCTALKTVTLGSGLTSMGDYPFGGCTKLSAITIPNGVTTMGVRTFWGCSSLSSVTLGSGLTAIGEEAFRNCIALKSIQIPGNIKEIGYGAFYGCTYLDTVTLNSGLETIGEMAFYGCSWLKDVSIPGTVKTVGASAFEGSSLNTVTLNSGLETIGQRAFYGCSGLTRVSIPGTVKTVGASAFKGTSLNSVTLNSGLETIGNRAFEGIFITGIALPDTLTSIGSYAFYNNDKLTAVAIPDGVTEIGEYTFADCAKLENVSFGSGLETIGSYAFYNCAALGSSGLTIPGKVTAICDYAFSGCAKLASVSFGSALETIGNRAFYGCAALGGEAGLTIPAKVTTIGEYAFYGCTALTAFRVDAENTAFSGVDGILYNKAQTTLLRCPGAKSGSVTVPGSVTAVEAYAFDGCAGITDVTMSSRVTSVGIYAFYTCDALTDVYYGGTADLWNSLESSSYEPFPEGVSVHYSTLMIHTQPADYETVEGVLAFFNMGADGDGLTYLWQISTDGGATWTDTTKTGRQYSLFAGAEQDGYRYRCVVTDKNGESLTSDEATLTVIVVPEAPTVSLTVKASNGKPQVTWKAVEGADQYEVWRSTSKDGDYTRMLTTTKTSYTNTSAYVGTAYYYKVRAITQTADGALVVGEFSTPKYVTCDCAQPVVTVTLNSSDKPKLTWEKVTGAAKYEIWRAAGQDSGYKKIYTMTGNVFTNTSAEAGETYYYKVRAVCGATTAGNSAYSAAKSVTVPGVPETPEVSLSVKASNGKPQLTWNAVTGASKYEVWRAVGKNSGYTKMLTTTKTTYVNTSAVAGTAYYYKVRAVGADGKSGFSTAKYVTCDCAQPVVSVKLNANDKPRLSWEKVTGASKYEIWRAVGQDSGYKKIYTMTGNVFTNSSVEEGETYYYKVRAVCGASSYGNSAFSTAKSVTVPIPLNIVSQPEDASAALGGKAKFTVEAVGEDLSYQWQYCTAKGTKWTNTTLTGNKTDTLTVGVTAGRDGYKYRCVITDVNGDSVTSEYGTLTVE